MMATALEHNGATVYIVGRRSDILEKAAKEHNVRSIHFFESSLILGVSLSHKPCGSLVFSPLAITDVDFNIVSYRNLEKSSRSKVISPIVPVY